MTESLNGRSKVTRVPSGRFSRNSPCYLTRVRLLRSFFALTGGQVCELDFISHLEDCEAILNEMVVNGWACPLSAESALAPTLAMRRAAIAQHGGGAGGSSAATTGAASRRA